MRFIVRVDSEGRIVIPEEIRRKYGIKDRAIIIADEEGVRIKPFKTLQELYGADGEVMREIAREITEERRIERSRECW